MDFESLDLVGGPFEPVETYVYYEGRRTFAMRSTTWPEFYYVVNTVDEDEETGSLTNLAVAVNGDRFRAIRSGTVPFREAFATAQRGTLSVIEWHWDDDIVHPAIRSIDAGDLPAAWLPAPGVRLDLPTHTVVSFKRDALVSLADAQSRSVFAVEVETAGARITEFPARNAGELQIALDGEIIALAKEFTAGSKSVAAKEIRASVLELQAASFVLVMAIDTPGALVEPTEVTNAVFTQLNSLITAVAAGDSAAFLVELKKHGPTVRNRFKDMLRPLSAVGSGIALSSVVANSRTVVRAAATPDHVRSAVEAIDNVEPDVSTIDIRRGVLTGLVLRTQRFEVVDSATMAIYKGYMTDDVAGDANGLSVGDHSFVTASIRVMVPFTNDDDDNTGVKYILESIARFDPASAPPEADKVTPALDS